MYLDMERSPGYSDKLKKKKKGSQQTAFCNMMMYNHIYILKKTTVNVSVCKFIGKSLKG